MGMNYRFETLRDLVTHKRNLIVECSIHCRNESIIDGEKLARWFKVHGWDMHLARVSQHLRCSKCWARPERVRVTAERATGPAWGPKSEADWTRAVKRMRD